MKELRVCDVLSDEQPDSWASGDQFDETEIEYLRVQFELAVKTWLASHDLIPTTVARNAAVEAGQSMVGILRKYRKQM